MNRTELFAKFNEATGKSLTQMKRYLQMLSMKSPYEDDSLEKLLQLSKEMESKEVWNKGVPMSEETKKRVSEAKKGQVPWNKGLKLAGLYESHPHVITEETKKIISEKLKKYYSTHPAPTLGRKHTPEECRKMRIASKGRITSEETKQKQREGVRKFIEANPDYGKRLSDIQKKLHQNRKLANDTEASLQGLVPYKDTTCKISQVTANRRIEHIKIGLTNYFKPEDLANAHRLTATSRPEQEMQDWVKSLGLEVICNDRKAISPKELDIYIPSKNLAIEFDGLYWHSVEKDATKEDINKHLSKTIECEKRGIRLMHIFEDEWNNKKDIVKSMIASACGIYERKVFARNCTCREISKEEALEFIKHNHLQDTEQKAVAYGLFYNDELLQVCTFRKNFAQRSNKELELARMCTLLNTQVVGGFSKLLKYAMEDMGETSITSFVDRRLFNAAGYMASGWEIDGEASEPRYFYTDGIVRENRQKYMKKLCLNKWPEFDDSMTEKDMCYQKGLRRIYDCGCIKVRYTI